MGGAVLLPCFLYKFDYYYHRLDKFRYFIIDIFQIIMVEQEAKM